MILTHTGKLENVQEIADQLEDFKSRAFGPNGLQIQLQQLKIR